MRSNGLYKILVDYCKGCRVCIEECPTGCLEGVPELDFDTGVVRMDTAFAITQGLHGRQAEELRKLPELPPKDIENWIVGSELDAGQDAEPRSRRALATATGTTE